MSRPVTGGPANGPRRFGDPERCGRDRRHGREPTCCRYRPRLGLGDWASGYLPTIPLTSRLLGAAPQVMPGGLPLIGGPDIPAMNYPQDWPGPHGSLQVGGFFTRAGARLSGPAAQAMVNHVPRPALTSTARLRPWLAARKIRYWIEYQPASRYWLFQAVLAAILLRPESDET